MLDFSLLAMHIDAGEIIKTVQLVNTIVCILLSAVYAYQFVYMAVALLKKPKSYAPTNQDKHYAVLIAARDEEAVLPCLLDSIKGQTYPADKIDMWVIADNCTDGTAAVAEQMGAHVVIRENKKLIGKGFALTYLLNAIKGDGKYSDKYDAFIVIDADNVLVPIYIEEMDKAFCSGYRIVTSYRNSKNFSDNWVSSGYALWFMREARYLNNPRCILNTSCAVSGTGFMFDSKIMDEENGWHYHLLTEDIQFTTDMICKGEKVGYAQKAMLFDEQPVRFKQSWTQRKRWSKGTLQVFKKHGWDLTKGVFRGSFSCYDMLMSSVPAFVISLFTIFINLFIIVLSIIEGEAGAVKAVLASLSGLFMCVYGAVFLWGALTIITERKNIYCPKRKLILYALTFPIFMITNLPCTIVVLFKRVGWDHIEHTVVRNKKQIEDSGKE